MRQDQGIPLPASGSQFFMAWYTTKEIGQTVDLSPFGAQGVRYSHTPPEDM